MNNISMYAHEGSLARMERANVRLIALCFLLILALIGSNAGWLYYESQFDDKVTTIEAEQDGSGTNMISGGDIEYGAESKDR